MKPSKYNIYYSLGNKDILLYNCLTDRMAIVDQEAQKSIMDGIIEDEELRIAMANEGFIVEDTVDELKIVRSKRMRAIADNYAAQVGMTFIMTYACNLSCTYCYEKGVRSLGGMMTADAISQIWEFVKRRIEEKKTVKRVVARLYGGEPLLNWDGCHTILKKIDASTKEYGIKKNVSLITNATLFTNTIWETLSSFGLEKLQITLDGCKKDHNQRRVTPQNEGTYDGIIKNIGEALDRGFTPEVRINLDEKNYQQVGILLDDLKEKGLTKIKIQVGVVSGLQMHCPSDRMSCIIPSSAGKIIPFVLHEIETRKFQITEGSLGNPVFCQFDLLDFYVVDPFLDVYKCWDLIGMKEHRIGKLNNSTFYPEYMYYEATSRDITQFNGCSDCDILPMCNGSCAARAYDSFGTYHAAGCYLERKLIEERIRRYIQKKMDVES